MRVSFQKGWLIVFALSFLPGIGVVSALFAQSLSFTKMTTLISPAPLSIDVGYFNSDKHLDIVTCGKTADGKGVATVFINNGTGGFTAGINFQSDDDPITVKTAYIDRDQNIDFAVLNASARNISIFLGDGNGFFDQKTKVKVPRNPTTFAVADIDGDSKSDLVVCFTDETPQLVVFVGNGSGKFKESTLIGLDGNVREIAAGSYGSDAPADVVVVYSNQNQVSLLTGDQDANLLSTKFGMNSAPRIAKLADLNGDGVLDAAVLRTSDDEVEAILNEGSGLGGRVFRIPVDALAEGLTLGDFNGDGRADIATCHQNSIVNIYRNDGTFGSTKPEPDPVMCMIVCDNSEAAPIIEVGVLPSMASVSLSLTDGQANLIRRFLDIESDLGDWVFSVEWNGTNDNEQVVDDGPYFLNYRLGRLLCYRPYNFKL